MVDRRFVMRTTVIPGLAGIAIAIVLLWWLS